ERRLDTLEDALKGQEGRQPELQNAHQALDAAKRSLKLVQNGNERIHRIVTNLREYAKARATSEPTDLSADLEVTLSLLGKRLDELGIRIHQDVPPLPKVLCRPGELNQVFVNLLLNSAQAMPQGGDIFIVGRCGEGRVLLTFRDTGPGILP